MITQAQVAESVGDRQASEILGVQAMKEWPWSNKAKDYLRGFISPRKFKKVSVLNTWVEFSSDASRLCFYEADKDGRYIKVLSTKDFSVVNKIPYPYSTPMRVIPDHDMGRIAVLDWDSLRVFNTSTNRIERTAFINAGSDRVDMIYGFSADNCFFISNRLSDVHFYDMLSEKTDSLIVPWGIRYEYKLIRGSLIQKIVGEDSVRFNKVLYSPVRTELIASADISAGMMWDYCPETGILAYTNSDGVVVWHDASQFVYEVAPESVKSVSLSPQLGYLFIDQNDGCITVNDKTVHYVIPGTSKWISPSDIMYKMFDGQVVIENVQNNDVFHVDEDMVLSSFISNEESFFNYESSTNSKTIARGYISNYLDKSHPLCVKYHKPKSQDNQGVKEFYYFDGGRKALLITENDSSIYCFDVESGDTLWKESHNYWTSNLLVDGIDEASGTAIIRNKLINLNTGGILHSFNGYGARFVCNDYIAVGSNEGIRLLKKSDYSIVTTIVDGDITNMISMPEGFIVMPQLGRRKDCLIYDCVRNCVLHISDNLSDKRDVSMSVDRTFFITHGIDRTGMLGDLRKNSFHVYDLETGTLVYEDQFSGHIRRATIANKNILCFILEDGVSFYDIRKKKLLSFYKSNFMIGYGNPVKVSDNTFLINVINDGIYEVNLDFCRVTKCSFVSNGLDVSLFNGRFLCTGGRVYDYYSGEVIARGVNNVVRIDSNNIYFVNKNDRRRFVEQKVPLLSNRQMQDYVKKEIGSRKLTDYEINYYQSLD